jgi:hypothetical protein
VFSDTVWYGSLWLFRCMELVPKFRQRFRSRPVHDGSLWRRVSVCVCRFVSAEVAEELAYRRNILTMSWCWPRDCARNIRTLYLLVSTPLQMSLCLFDLSTRKFLVQFTVLRGVNYRQLAQDPVTWHTSPLGYITVQLTRYMLGFGVKVINYHLTKQLVCCLFSLLVTY